MHKIELPDKKITIEFASAIEEMNYDDFSRLLELVLLQKTDQISESDFRTMFTMVLLGAKKNAGYYLADPVKRERIHDNLARIGDLLDSFCHPEEINGEVKMVMDLKFVKQMIPRIGRYYGPDDALTNCTFYEYKEAYNFYRQYLQDKDPHDLDLMIAVLYRPRKSLLFIQRLMPGYNGQERRQFNSKTNHGYLQHRARVISKVPFHIKMGVFLWFESCENYLRNGIVKIDGNEIDFSILYKNSEPSGKPGIGLTGLLFTLSESAVFGNLEETSDTNLYDIMARLYQLKSDYDSQLEKMRQK